MTGRILHYSYYDNYYTTLQTWWPKGVSNVPANPLGSVRITDFFVANATSVIFSMLGMDAATPLSSVIQFDNFSVAAQASPHSITVSGQTPPPIQYTGAAQIVFGPGVLRQKAGTPIYTADTFSPAPSYGILGTALQPPFDSQGSFVVDEPRCGLACMEAAGCTGYTYSGRQSASADVGSGWNGMPVGITSQNCFLYSNISGLVPNVMLRSGLLRAALPRADSSGGGGAGSNSS